MSPKVISLDDARRRMESGWRQSQFDRRKQQRRQALVDAAFGGAWILFKLALVLGLVWWLVPAG